MNEVRYGRRVSLFALRDKDSGVLLQHRDDGAPILPNYWAFFGGGIEEGESPVDAARRKAMVEILKSMAWLRNLFLQHLYYTI